MVHSLLIPIVRARDAVDSFAYMDGPDGFRNEYIFADIDSAPFSVTFRALTHTFSRQRENDGHGSSLAHLASVEESAAGGRQGAATPTSDVGVEGRKLNLSCTRGHLGSIKRLMSAIELLTRRVMETLSFLLSAFSSHPLSIATILPPDLLLR